MERLNPEVPEEALKLAEDELTRDRTAVIRVAANREVLSLLTDGVRVEIKNADGKFEDILVKVIDWKNPSNNDFLAANQVWIEGVLHKRRPDTIGYVNGLPLLLAEWKAPTSPLADAYEKNLRDYKDAIPQLFQANGFVILSNGLETVMGGSHAPYQFFSPWKKLEEGGPVALEGIKQRDGCTSHISGTLGHWLARQCWCRNVLPFEALKFGFTSRNRRII